MSLRLRRINIRPTAQYPTAYILGILLFVQITSPASAQASIPFALAPVGQFGASVVPEFDRRTLSGELVYQRRACFRIGWTPAKFLTLWGEGGVGSLQYFEGERLLQGDFGPAAGAGWSYLWKKPIHKGWTPFASGRATFLQSKLSDDQYQGGNLRSRRSRFEWNEVTVMAGGVKVFKWGVLEGGLEFRRLGQDEFRDFRSGSSVQSNQYVYSSGLQPGVALGVEIPLPYRLTLWALGEASANFQKLTISCGQWGAP